LENFQYDEKTQKKRTRKNNKQTRNKIAPGQSGRQPIPNKWADDPQSKNANKMP